MYDYRALPERYFIRLIDLAPGVWSDPPECLITETALVEAPPNDALSYTWGEDSRRYSIKMDRRRLLTTTNLNSALRRLRHRAKSRRVWVDALCINQNDVKEREEQVQYMSSIFKHAQRVVVYLGEEADGSERIPDLFRAYGYLRRLTKSLFPQRYSENPEVGPAMDIEPAAASSLSWASARAFFGRPWFRRAWVVQEVLFAKDLTFICGSWELPRSVVREAVVGFIEFPEDNLYGRLLSEPGSDSNAQGLLQLFSLFALAEDNGRYVPRNLIELGVLIFETKAQDPRDFYYAILGCSNASAELTLIPSYTEPWHCTYERYAKYLINEGFGLQILYHASADSSSLNKDNGTLPSWAPDLSFKRRLPLLLQGHGPDNIKRYAAGTVQSAVFKFGDVKKTLITPAILLDRIQHLGCCDFGIGDRPDSQVLKSNNTESYLQSSSNTENPFNTKQR